MEWIKLDLNNPPDEPGEYVYMDDADGVVWTCTVYDDINLVDAASHLTGTIPTHYVYLEPLPISELEDEDGDE